MRAQAADDKKAMNALLVEKALRESIDKEASTVRLRRNALPKRKRCKVVDAGDLIDIDTE